MLPARRLFEKHIRSVFPADFISEKRNIGNNFLIKFLFMPREGKASAKKINNSALRGK